MADFAIKADSSSDHLTIRLPETRTIYGSCNGYVEVEVEIKVGAFGGKYRTEFTNGDLPALRSELQELYGNLSGNLKFYTLEGQLEFTIKGDGRGHFEAECEANESSGGNESRLIFTLKFDQTQLPRMIGELNAMLV